MFEYIIEIPQDTRYQSNLNEIGLSEQKSFLDKSQNGATGTGSPSGTALDGNVDSDDANSIVAIAWLVMLPTLLITLRAEVCFRHSLSLC